MLSAQEHILEVEAVLSPAEYDAHSKTLGSIAATIADVSLDVIPVVTNPVYKHGLSPNGLEGTAKIFEQSIMRLAGSKRRHSMAVAADSYAAQMGLATDRVESTSTAISPDNSDWVLTLATRRSFVDTIGALDTTGVRRRIERLRDHGGWMICILDAPTGLFVTNSKTEELVDTLLEADFGNTLDTQINPSPGDSPDIPVFSKPQALTNFLVSKGLVTPADSRVTSPDGNEQVSIMDMAEMFEIFMTTDQPDNRSLEDFEQWIFATGTARSFHKEYLLAVLADMKSAIKVTNLDAREDAVKQIRESLTDALLKGLEPYIVRECARVINRHVLGANLLVAPNKPAQY